MELGYSSFRVGNLGLEFLEETSLDEFVSLKYSLTLTSLEGEKFDFDTNTLFVIDGPNSGGSSSPSSDSESSSSSSGSVNDLYLLIILGGGLVVTMLIMVLLGVWFYILDRRERDGAASTQEEGDGIATTLLISG